MFSSANTTISRAYGPRDVVGRAAALVTTLVVLVAAISPAAAAAAKAPSASMACRDVTIPVALAPALPKNQSIYGQYCGAAAAAPVLQILVHGATYDHTYWDFPGFNGKYSYTRYMRRAGHATLAIDLLGVGRSSQPLSVLVTQTTVAHTLHGVVQAARSGALGRRWEDVVLVGHSFGTLTSFLEAGTYSDVDGIVATGASHSPGPVALAELFSRVRPARFDPATRNDVPPYDLGYLSIPGARKAAFYEPRTSDPEVVEADEANRAAGTVGFAATVPLYIPATTMIDVPVLLANGGHDAVFCRQGGGGSLTDCSSAAALYRSEKPFFPQAQLQTYVLPGAGHAVNLHLNNQKLFARMHKWLDENFTHSVH